MKKTIILLFISGLLTGSLFAQNRDSTMMYRKHCAATRIGEGLMIGGGAVTVLSGLGYLVNVSVHPGSTHKDEPTIYVAFAAIGADIVLNGLIVYVAGRIYEKRNKDRFTLIAKKNEIGIAYNF